MRNQNWEKRLADYISGEREKPFVWGQNDCIAFAAKGANEVVSRDLLQEFQSYGNYAEEEAKKMLSEHGSIEAFFDKHFKRRVNKSFIQRGDIAVVEFRGIKAAGIVDNTGRTVACKTLDGLLHVPVSKIIAAWDVEKCPL